jgi:hypothetical protein
MRSIRAALPVQYLRESASEQTAAPKAIMSKSACHLTGTHSCFSPAISDSVPILDGRDAPDNALDRLLCQAQVTLIGHTSIHQEHVFDSLVGLSRCQQRLRETQICYDGIGFIHPSVHTSAA